MHEIQLVVLRTIEWTSAVLAPPAPLPALAFRSATAPSKGRTVPIVARDLRVAALDKDGSRLPRLRALLLGPFPDSVKKKPPTSKISRAISADAKGIFHLKNLRPGRYIVEARGVRTEVVIVKPKEVLP